MGLDGFDEGFDGYDKLREALWNVAREWITLLYLRLPAAPENHVERYKEARRSLHVNAIRARRVLVAIPADALTDLSIRTGQPWDIQVRRTLLVLCSKPMFPLKSDPRGKWHSFQDAFCEAHPKAELDCFNELILDLDAIEGKPYAVPDNFQPAGAGNGQDGTRTGNDKPGKSLPPMPPREAWVAYYLRQCGDGLSQEQIAKRLSKRGIEMSQATVSRKLAAVDAFLAAGGMNPPLEELAAAPDPRRAVTMDSAILDMGARQDGLTPRQRDKADPADDDE